MLILTSTHSSQPHFISIRPYHLIYSSPRLCCPAKHKPQMICMNQDVLVYTSTYQYDEAMPTYSAEQGLLYALFLVLYLLFWISVQDLAACNLDLRTARLHKLTYSSMRGGIPLDQDKSSPCYYMGPMHALFFCMKHIISLLYHYYTYYFKIWNCIWVRIHCRKIAHQHIHHRGSVSVQTQNIRDSNINLQQAVSHAVSCRDLSIGIGLAHVRQPARTQFWFELITQSIDSCGNGWALFLPEVIGNSKINTNLWNKIYN